jgi:hypothetical protein
VSRDDSLSVESFGVKRQAHRQECLCYWQKIWLGGLDSNQDNQIQNLMYCRLYDLPAEGDKKSAEIAGTMECLTSGIYTLFMKCN